MFKVNSKFDNLKFISAGDKGYGYIGRFDEKKPDEPVIIWQGSVIKSFFTGKKVGLKFLNAWGQNFFNIIIDGKIHILKVSEPGENDYMLDETLGDGRHELIIFKRTESMFSHVSFKGLYIEQNAFIGPAPAQRKRIEFYGDSITAGACNEDPGVDQYDDYSSHNNYMSYAAITARGLGYDYVNISVSGTGLCYSWNPVYMIDIYDKLYPDKESPRYDFYEQMPDIVIINLGQNDLGYPVSIGKPFPSDFGEKYIKFVTNLRSLYPTTEIVCAMGGMSSWKDSPDLQKAFKETLAYLKSNDRKIHSFEFEAFAYTHPRVDTHIKLAEELTGFLKKEFDL